ncbi:hypothetical protein [Fictibacillus arsenicus]|uniref:QacE n=1 Tax=Fictibacillus arsenicus TaxID=255247 RepID=A0A1V3GB65_9BACL|nr:hypothetical protein [Fictibacillus arsenicus]OOE14057.1 hypothetical protein UN64_02255 [Fictibacillus arsenicus]
MEEHKFLENEEILISSTRLVLKNKTIVMGAVCSVELDKEDFPTPWFFIVITIVGLLMALVSPFPNINSIGWLFTVLGGIMVLLKWTKKRKEAVIIELSSGEKEFIDDSEVQDLTSVFKAINDVILFRG